MFLQGGADMGILVFCAFKTIISSEHRVAIVSSEAKWQPKLVIPSSRVYREVLRCYVFQEVEAKVENLKKKR